MKRFFTLSLILFPSLFASAQTIFWLEEFTNGCPSLCTSYSGPNGAWTFTSNGPASACGGATTPNLWYISCAENGNAPGACGTGCGSNATLHVGNDPLSPSAGIFCPSGDCGAAYDAGGYCGLIGSPPSTETDILAESPVIDCTGRNTITLSFNYIERGQGMSDNATVLYYDGSVWSQLADMAKTPLTCGSGQGLWTAYSIALPASADNNPNVAIAFHWVNDDDGGGNDPSFAVDSVRLSEPGGGIPPVAAFSEDTTAGCDSLCVTFTDNSTGATSWSWSFPGGNPTTSTQANPVVCYNTPGTYTVQQIVTNSFGADTIVKTNHITVTATPVPNFSSSDQALCVGECIDYTDLSTGTIQNYTWTFQGGTPLTSSDQNPTNICYQVVGSFNTTLTVSNGPCINSNTHVAHINVSEAAEPTITVNGAQLQSSAALTYQWYLVGQGAIPAAIFQSYTVPASGDYYVCITDPLGCAACSDTVTVILDQINNPSDGGFSFYPNPVNEQLTIASTGNTRIGRLRICDVTGRVLVQNQIHWDDQEVQVRFQDFSAGSYVVQLLDGDAVLFVQRIIKE